MTSQHDIYKCFDLIDLGLLHEGWDREVKSTVDTYGVCTVLDGRSITSRESSDSGPVEVCVVDGDIVNSQLPWLYNLYLNQLAKLAFEFSGKPVTIASNLKSSVNINLLRGAGARYERHVDSNPVTGILFVTTHNISEQGGGLVFECQGADIIVIPKAGRFIVFDAREIIHYVAPLKADIDRISIPMNYYLLGEEQMRPNDLNLYLYGSVK